MQKCRLGIWGSCVQTCYARQSAEPCPYLACVPSGETAHWGKVSSLRETPSHGMENSQEAGKILSPAEEQKRVMKENGDLSKGVRKIWSI